MDHDDISRGAGITVQQVSMALWIAAATQPPAARRPVPQPPTDWTVMTDPDAYLPVPSQRRPVPWRKPADAPAGTGNDAELL
jgi:hypothetical protein